MINSNILEALNKLKVEDKGFVILFDGGRLKMPSGKLMWSTRGDAMKALRVGVKKYLAWDDRYCVTSVIDSLVEEGRIQIVGGE